MSVVQRLTGRIRPAVQALRSVSSRTARAVLGEVDWRAPPWLKWSATTVRSATRAVAEQSRQKPRQAALVAIATVAVLGGGYAGWRQRRRTSLWAKEAVMIRSSDRAWVALAGAVAAYDLIATDDEQLTNAARRYLKCQPIATVSTILVTSLHLVGWIPPWCDPITLTFAAHRRLVRGFWFRRSWIRRG